MIYEKTYDMVTDDIFMRLPYLAPGAEVFLKIEGLNPAGSVKLKTALSLIEDAENHGRLKPGARIIESSSGNLGIALSSICATKGYAFTCVVDPNTSATSADLMRALGTEVVVVDTLDANGGFLQSRISYIQQRTATDPTMIWLNQYANPANPRAHYDQTASSMLKELQQIDYLFVGVGSTGTFVGCAEYFREYSPDTRVVAVDAAGSVTFGGVPGRRRIPGLGASRRPELCRPELADEVVYITELDAVRECRLMAREHGLLVGGSTGSVLAAIRQRGGTFPTASRIAAISPDLGERYLRTVYDDAWVAEQFGGLW
ncbi:2,3-diaminopropionate biosynthesis protein SbnA [Streptomyces sp. SL13]|uniref:2,3-diaminopropionate biosynthesis protein SbnA n=1 Tax=Streptantibioticus silvisoli TaxID=2705255 RepID=A0AA90KGT7_9ACTN|nr:2,3-diaminopropionate biosynthesis protein SbnA [Streptantibioticus silvisoli]MDI5962219.1 2,3-diaminopropionate biosynthesis protein SbnA [Streptantibioticus silvisoli]MDI5970649.1 2,3-diaminopropionate biosynthesis protein SbnA [Streptantibioticus silvisoli]